LGKLQGRLERGLTLYIQHMAWLQATPKPDPRSRRGKLAEQSTAPRLSRIAALKAKKVVPPMPPNPAPHITDRLIEMGLTQAAGMGAVPLSWGEINAWCDRTAVDLEPWEARLIRRLSAAYLAESHKADDENCPPPWAAPVTAREIEIEEAQLRAVLG
jgi:hypothetical protein